MLTAHWLVTLKLYLQKLERDLPMSKSRVADLGDRNWLLSGLSLVFYSISLRSFKCTFKCECAHGSAHVYVSDPSELK